MAPPLLLPREERLVRISARAGARSGSHDRDAAHLAPVPARLARCRRALARLPGDPLDLATILLELCAAPEAREGFRHAPESTPFVPYIR